MYYTVKCNSMSPIQPCVPLGLGNSGISLHVPLQCTFPARFLLDYLQRQRPGTSHATRAGSSDCLCLLANQCFYG